MIQEMGSPLKMHDLWSSVYGGCWTSRPRVTLHRHPHREENHRSRGALLTKLAVEMGARQMILETDNKGAMQQLTRQELNRSRLGPFIEEIKGLLSSMDEFPVVWARRCANRAAHSLAREGCLNKICKTWFTFPPFCISDVIADETIVST